MSQQQQRQGDRKGVKAIAVFNSWPSYPNQQKDPQMSASAEARLELWEVGEVGGDCDCLGEKL